MSRSISWSVVGALAFASAFPPLYMAFFVFGPKVEAMALPPVEALAAAQARCEGGDQIVEGTVAKRRGVFADMTATSDGVRVAWEAADQPANTPTDRPVGTTTLRLRLIGNCGRPFTLHTVHRADHGLWHLRQRWGPFGPGTTTR